MTLGQKLKKLRNDKGLTQKDLADQLHVTFQTISKWESDTNEPDIATIKELAKFFGCSFDYLLSDEEASLKEEKVVEEVKEDSDKTIIIHQYEPHVCERCKKNIDEGDLEIEETYSTRTAGRHTYRTGGRPRYYHRNCLEIVKKERQEQADKIKNERARKIKKLSFGWGIAVGIIGLIISLIVFLNNTDVINPGLGVLFSILIGYALFAMLYCIISGSYIGDVFVWCATLSIKFPGLIFSWSPEGFAWLIIMKIAFAVIGFLFGIAALLFAIVFSAALGSISFPFVLIHNKHINYQDSF